ncbi:hypothetical protein PENTCL1PPCAC_9426, partial [Pristionchus entomophagus]
VCCARLRSSTEVCPVGMSALRRRGGRPSHCSSGSCPDGYLCKFSIIKKKYFCCGRTKRDSCTNRALLDKSGRKIDCTEDESRCPKGYSCSPATSGYECCPDNVERSDSDEDEEGESSKETDQGEEDGEEEEDETVEDEEDEEE